MPNRSTLSAAALTALTACTSINAEEPPKPSVDACLPAALDRYKGQTATAELGARMLAGTGKTVLRWVPPGTMVTMDFREDRLTVYLDAANRVERVSCG